MSSKFHLAGKKSLLLLLAIAVSIMFMPTSKVFATADETCKDQDQGVVNSCKLGYENVLEGKSIEDACKNFSGPSETACEIGAAAGVTGKANGEQPSSTPPANQADCDVQLFSPLSWIICPVLDLGASLTDFVFKDIVGPLLKDVPVSTDPKDPAFQAWQQFRILGNILLIGSLLAVVYSQARGPK
jgi:hypothetical protein